MYKEIINENFQTILNYYLKEDYKKSEIAHKLINDLDLDFTNSQVDSFRRSLSQSLSDWELNNTAQNIGEDGKEITPDKYANIKKTRARVLILDLETTPIIGSFWRLFKVNIPINQIYTDSRLICWCAKWLYEPEQLGDVITVKEAKANHKPEKLKNMFALDDERIVRSLWEVMDEADIIIAHNAKQFDIKVANTMFLRYGMNPPSPYVIIDTLDIAKKTFRFPSNKLDYINRSLSLPEKIKTDFDLWLGCMEGDEKCINDMFIYCHNDVGILEEHYVIIRPWIKSHPNMGFYVNSNELICPTCGCTELNECGTYNTNVNEYIAFRCPNCGAVGRSRKSSTSVEKKKSLTVSVAR